MQCRLPGFTSRLDARPPRHGPSDAGESNLPAQAWRKHTGRGSTSTEVGRRRGGSPTRPAPGAPAVAMGTATHFRKQYGAWRGPFPAARFRGWTGLRGASYARCCVCVWPPARRPQAGLAALAGPPGAPLVRPGRRRRAARPWTSPGSWRKTST